MNVQCTDHVRLGIDASSLLGGQVGLCLHDDAETVQGCAGRRAADRRGERGVREAASLQGGLQGLTQGLAVGERSVRGTHPAHQLAERLGPQNEVNTRN